MLNYLLNVDDDDQIDVDVDEKSVVIEKCVKDHLDENVYFYV